MKKRIKWVDCLRFFAIFSIYLYHFGDVTGKACSFINLYHIKLFFFISGFFFTAVINTEELSKRLIKTVYRVALPTCLFIVINVVFFSIINSFSIEQTLSLLKTYSAMKKGSGIGGIWFVGCFFFTSVLHVLASYFIKNKYVVFLLSVSAYFYITLMTPYTFTGHLFASIDLIPQYWVYYSLGSIVFPLLKRMDTSDRPRMSILRIGLFVLTGIYTAMSYSLGQNIDFDNNIIANSFESIILILFFTISAQYIAKQLKYNSIIMKIGQATLVLCVTENMTKQIVTRVLAVVGVELQACSLITAIILAAVYLLLGYMIWFKCIAGIFPVLSGHYSPKQVS